MSEALAPPPREEVASEGNQPAASRPGRKKPSSSVPPAETPAATPGKMPRPKIGPACVRTPIGRDLGRGVSRTFVRGRTVRRGCGGDSASGSGDSSVGVSAPGASAAGGDGSVAPRRAIVRSIDMLVASAAATLKVAHPSGPEAISCAASLGRSGSVRTIDARSCEPLRTMRVVTAIGFAPPGRRERIERQALANGVAELALRETARVHGAVRKLDDGRLSCGLRGSLAGRDRKRNGREDEGGTDGSRHLSSPYQKSSVRRTDAGRVRPPKLEANPISGSSTSSSSMSNRCSARSEGS